MGTVILNVDDDDAGRYAVTHILRSAGFEVIESSTGEQTMALMNESVDLVLLDVNLPGIDGFEVCRRIKSDPRTRTVPVIHLSASRMTQPDKVLGLDSGADGYLVEPIGRDELVATVQAHIRARQLVLREARRQHEFERQLVGIVSHDLRTPLSAIHATAAVLLAHGDDKVAQAGERIMRVSGRMGRLVKELLDFTQARIGRGIVIHAGAVDLVALLKRTVDEALVTHSGRVIEIDAPERLQGTWDEDRLEQILGNLVGNALAYSPPESHVSVSLRADGEDVILAISNPNRGKAITPELMKVLFEPFTRGGDDAERYGLGLFIVHHLVRAHGGDIAVESTEHGTTFTIRLPRRTMSVLK